MWNHLVMRCDAIFLFYSAESGRWPWESMVLLVNTSKFQVKIRPKRTWKFEKSHNVKTMEPIHRYIYLTLRPIILNLYVVKCEAKFCALRFSRSMPDKIKRKKKDKLTRHTRSHFTFHAHLGYKSIASIVEWFWIPSTHKSDQVRERERQRERKTGRKKSVCGMNLIFLHFGVKQTNLSNKLAVLFSIPFTSLTSLCCGFAYFFFPVFIVFRDIRWLFER